MRRAAMRLLPLLASIALTAPGLPAQEAPCDPAFRPAVDTVRAMVSNLGLKGAALILRRKGRTVCEVYAGSFGPQTMMPIVSAAKWLSAAAILTLVDEGKLRLDDSVSHWLPYFKGDKKAITLRQLLSHTSGLPNYLPCMFLQQLQLDECARQIAEKTDLAARPGAEFAYGGAAYTVAGRVAEVAAGAPWAQVFATHLAQPLGLSHTGYGTMPNPMLSEGQVYSSPADYITFLQMVLDDGMHDGRRVLSAEMIEEMTRDQTAGVTGRVSPRGDQTYGLGCWRDVVDSTTGRALLLTSPGAGGFVPWVNRTRGMVGVLAVFDKIDRVWPTALAVLQAARNGAIAMDSATSVP
ncbi:MAG TPA: serine hydrolase domain-containing protein [Gemmatimonadales bacterium]|nr:serine hydrolase domain-containing protein [Gemmatimonadales bacterium]